jgi:hypothetical protein
MSNPAWQDLYNAAFLSQKTDSMELLLVLEWLPRISPRFPVIAVGSAYVQSRVAGFVQRSVSRSRSR